VINKIDLAEMVSASLEIMDSDTKHMHNEKSYVFANLKIYTGVKTTIGFIVREGVLDNQKLDCAS